MRFVTVTFRTGSLVGLFASSVCGTAAWSAQLPPIAFLSMGFREATMADVSASPQASLRQVDPDHYLTVTADFNGDGKPDEARILINTQRNLAYVVAVIQSPTKVDTYVLSQMALPDVSNVGIALASPLSDDRTRTFAGVTIFALDSGKGEASYLDGGEFSTRVAVSRPSPKL